MTDSELRKKAEEIVNKLIVSRCTGEPDFWKLVDKIESILRELRDSAIKEFAKGRMTYTSHDYGHDKELVNFMSDKIWNEAISTTIKVIDCHDTVDPDRKRSESYRRAVNEIRGNILRLKKPPKETRNECVSWM